jgi:hypothetical protein
VTNKGNPFGRCRLRFWFLLEWAGRDDDDVESNGEPDALDGLSDVLCAELLTLTSSGSVRLRIGGPGTTM